MGAARDVRSKISALLARGISILMGFIILQYFEDSK